MPSVVFLCQSPARPLPDGDDMNHCWYTRKWSLHRAGEQFVANLRQAHGLAPVGKRFDTVGFAFGMVLCEDGVFHGHIGPSFNNHLQFCDFSYELSLRYFCFLFFSRCTC